MLRAYYAALKPARTYANIMTTLAGFLFACRWHIHGALLFYALVGMTLVVMSACATNNVTDRAIDAKMPRTRQRGTVTGEVSARKLAIIAITFGLVGFAILGVHVNWLTTLLAALAYVDYVVLYGWSKRTTPWSTLIGTISGAVPLVAGYTAVTNHFGLTALLLGLIMVWWQMVHFYAIAIFRHDDYKAGHLPVWSLRYGVRNTQKWMIFYTLLYLVTVILLTLFASVGWVFLAVVGSLGLYWLYLGLKGFMYLKPEKWARTMFGFSLVNLLLLAGMISVASM